jgi:hypothetical protein
MDLFLTQWSLLSSMLLRERLPAGQERQVPEERQSRRELCRFAAIRLLPIISALARGTVENSAIADLVSPKSVGASNRFIANAEQSYTIFRLDSFGCVLARG